RGSRHRSASQPEALPLRWERLLEPSRVVLERPLRQIRTADVPVIPAAVGRGVLPFMLDQRLIAGAVMEEERGHGAGRDNDCVARGEVSIDEGGRGAARVGKPVAVRIVRRLYRTRRKRNDEVALHAAA